MIEFNNTAKLQMQTLKVSEDEIKECFGTKNPSMKAGKTPLGGFERLWFIAETLYGRRFLIVYVERNNENVYVIGVSLPTAEQLVKFYGTKSI